MNILDFEKFLNEDTSATGGPAVSGTSVAAPSGGGVALANATTAGMGPVQSSQPSAFPGALNGTNWINGGGKSGSGDIGVPYNPSGANRVFQKIPAPMGKNHGSKTGKKSREKKLDLKNLRDMLKNRPKSGSGKIMNFDNFAKNDITSRVTKVKESSQEDNIENCELCGCYLYYDSDYGGDMETMGGYSVTPLICSNSKCGQKYEVIDDPFEPKTLKYRD